MPVAPVAPGRTLEPSAPSRPVAPIIPLMHAIIVSDFGGPEVMRAAQVDDPVADPGHVVVRVRAAGVNPVDTYIRAGTLCAAAAASLHARVRRCRRGGVGRAPA